MAVPNPEYDKPGYCAICHNPIAEFDGANNIVRLLGNFRSMQVRLDDNSKMNVSVCEVCKDEFRPQDTPKLMDSVVKGWSFECDTLVENGVVRIDGRKWDADVKKEHMDKYEARYIVERMDEKWSQDTIVEAVYAEEIAAGLKLEEEKKDK